MKTLNELANLEIKELLKLSEEELKALFAAETSTDLSPLLENSGMFSFGAYEASLLADAMVAECLTEDLCPTERPLLWFDQNIDTTAQDWSSLIDNAITNAPVKFSEKYYSHLVPKTVDTNFNIGHIVLPNWNLMLPNSSGVSPHSSNTINYTDLAGEPLQAEISSCEIVGSSATPSYGIAA